ncbi:metallophosphoesterase [Fibrella sp. WM1]|uniref:metallophosphoesterase family protein n=1 Tax=Fibrella musci TaxID=3242485 RepID=UPI0035216C80
MNRRSLLKAAGALPLLSVTNPTLAAPQRAARVLRFAYLGDTHIQAERKPMQSLSNCLHHIQKQADKPSMLLHGGDVIMDALGQDRDRVQAQWTAWQQVMKADNSLPIQYCIGNHDVWGFSGAKTDPMWGKKWVADQLQLNGRYRSFDWPATGKNGWHFIILDSTQPDANGKWYTAHLDPEQLDWLKADLAKTDAKTPILILSHIPIVSATVFYDKQNVKEGNWLIPGSWNHTDATDLIELFARHPNVKACLSGHMHLLDHVTYNNVQYFCNGSVCGNWWASDTYHQTKAGYALFDLYADGTLNRTYVSYE